jgi:hypothetical protein
MSWTHSSIDSTRAGAGPVTKNRSLVANYPIID